MKELVVELGSYSLTAGTQNAEAYREYMKGRYFWNKRTKEGQDRAIAHFNRAIELDPTYALAYAGLADATVFTYGINLAERNRAISAGRALLYKAIEFDATLAEPHATLGLLAMNVDHDWIEAERLFKRSIELDRSYPTAHQWYGEFLAYMGRFDEGITELELAQELDPLSLIISTDLGQVYYNARQYERSLDQLQKTLEMDPDYVAARQWRGLALSALGRHNEAIAEFEKVPDLRDDQIMLSCAGVVYGEAGRKEKAHWVLERLKALSSETYVWPSSMARAYIGLGDNDGAFKWLEKAFSESDVGVIALKISPVVDSLRDDRRFAGYLRRAGF